MLDTAQRVLGYDLLAKCVEGEWVESNNNGMLQLLSSIPSKHQQYPADGTSLLPRLSTCISCCMGLGAAWSISAHYGSPC
jgi:hypothetical protein